MKKAAPLPREPDPAQVSKPHPKPIRKPDPRQEMSTQRRAVIVLGMHRSGTSALTRVISLLGADLPSSLMPANLSNEAGFFEFERSSDCSRAAARVRRFQLGGLARLQSGLVHVPCRCRFQAARSQRAPTRFCTISVVRDQRPAHLPVFPVLARRARGVRRRAGGCDPGPKSARGNRFVAKSRRFSVRQDRVSYGYVM